MTDRFTLAAITVVAVLAASVAASLMPGGWLNPALTWACVYVAGVLGTARAVHLPPGRVLVASVLLLGTVLALVLATLRTVLDAALTLLSQLNARGLDALKEATA